MFVGQPSRLAALLLLFGLLPGCELIASFDRDKIPEPGFMVPDATTLPQDGSVIESGLPPPEEDASTDGGADAGMDASVDAGEDASTDPGMDASIDAGDDDMDASVDAGDTDGGM